MAKKEKLPPWMQESRAWEVPEIKDRGVCDSNRMPKIKRWRKRERTTENAVVRWAKQELGIISRKMNGMGFNSWPDRMYMLPGAPLFHEYKRAGEVATPLQEENHTWLRSLGYVVEVHDNTAQAIASIRRHAVEAIRNTKAGNKISTTTRRRRTVP